MRGTANEIHLAVRDTGIGIPAHAMKELFQDFHQLEAGDGRRYEGTGVGLALSRRLARALGGEIEVRSQRGRGFDLHARPAARGSAADGRSRARRACRRLPISTGAASVTRRDAPSLSSMGDAGGDVLIVDDFPDTLALYEAVLSEDGHKVRTAQSGVEALRQVDEREPEVVLLDVSMPGLDGVEVLRRLRARRGGGPSVLMLTAARREPHAIEAGLKEGADAYLTKPIDSRELMARVRAALETFRLKRMLEAQRRDHIAMLVHDLRHPLSSLGLIAEVLESEDMSPDERARGRRADPRHVHRDGAPGRRRPRREPPRGGRLLGRARASIKVGAVIEPDARGLHPGGDAPPRRARRSTARSTSRCAPTRRSSARRSTTSSPTPSSSRPRGGRVVCACAREDGRASLFEIADTGPGIAASERDEHLRPLQAGLARPGRRAAPGSASPSPAASPRRTGGTIAVAPATPAGRPSASCCRGDGATACRRPGPGLEPTSGPA